MIGVLLLATSALYVASCSNVTSSWYSCSSSTLASLISLSAAEYTSYCVLLVGEDCQYMASKCMAGFFKKEKEFLKDPLCYVQTR